MAIAGAWILFAIIFVAVSILCYLFVNRYADPHEKDRMTTFVAAGGLVLLLLCLSVIPVDIYNASHSDDPADNASGIRGLYYTAFIILFIYSFVVIPFVYFYFEEQDEDITPSQRMCAAMKYTVISIIIAVVLLVLALSIRFDNDEKKSHGFVDDIVGQQSKTDASISFLVACMALLGLLGYLGYGGFGLGFLPIDMLRGKESVNQEAEDVNEKLTVVREKIRAIESKYDSVSRKKMKRKDRKQLEKLRRESRLLSHLSSRYYAATTGWWNKVSRACAPFQRLFGGLLALVVVFVMVSLILTTIDRAYNSCGAKCGYMMKKSSIVNPLDVILVAFSKAFPMDYVALGSLMLLFFITAVAGIVRLGIRCCCMHLYKVKVKGTMPQALLLTCLVMMFVILVVIVELPAFAPQYVNFGSQTFVNDKGHNEPCSFDAVLSEGSESKCHISEIGKLVGRIVLNVEMFSIIFYYTAWAFVAYVSISAFFVSFQERRKAVELDSDDDEEIVGVV